MKELSNCTAWKQGISRLNGNAGRDGTGRARLITPPHFLSAF